MWMTRHQKEIMTQLISCLFLVACLKCSAASVPVVVSIDEIGDQITTITGEAGNYVFGGKVLSLGDINGDGFEDMAFFAESTMMGENNFSYIFLGRESLPNSVDMAEWRDWGIRLHAPDGHRSPLPLQGIGDINHDGYDDVAFRSCRTPVVETECPAYILFGGTDLPNDIDTSTFEGCRGCRIYLDEDDVQDVPMVSDVAAGDINGDGLKDLVVSDSSAQHEGMKERAGMVHVVFGTDPFPESINLTEIGSTHAGFIMYSTSPGETYGFGNKVSSGIDFNGDGIDDIVAGSDCWDRVDSPDGEHEGAFFVVFGRNSWPGEIIVDANQEGVCRIVGTQHFETISRFILHAKYDVNGDAVPDILCDGKSCMYLVSGSDLSPGRFVMDEIMTTRLEYERFFRGIGMNNWNDDAIGDMVFGSTCYDTVDPEIQSPGSVFIVTGRTEYPEISTLGDALPRLQITGSSSNFFLGKQLCTADVNGDGRSDIVTSAYFDPGFIMDPPEGSPPGKVFIIPGGTDLKRVFRCVEFSPKRSTLSGGGDLRITGAGFDENTLVFLGDETIDIQKIEDSRTIIAEIPGTDEPGRFPVRIERGDESLVFEEQFEYYDSLFPSALDVLELGDRGCIIFEPRWEEGEYTLYPNGYRWFTGGGEDFNGDGLCEVLVTRGASGNEHLDYYKEFQEVLLLYGSKELPSEMTTEEIPEWGAVFIADREVNVIFGENAILTGDLNGDGRSELAIWAKRIDKVFIIFGGPAIYGEKSVYDLMDEGRCCVLENVQFGTVDKCGGSGKLLTKCGDVNGDGLADLALSAECTYAPDDTARSSIAFVLGRQVFPASLSFDSLPKVYGKTGGTCCLHSTRGIGDVDGDGFDDITFYRNYKIGDSYDGRQCIYFGRESFTEDTFYEDELISEGLCEIYKRNDGYSVFLAGIGDQNGDKKNDLGIYSIPTPPFTSYSVPKQAKLRILYGGDREMFNTLRSIFSDDDFDLIFTTESGEYGRFDRITGGRDINYDGFPDILIRDRHGERQQTPPPSRMVAIFGGNLEEKEGPFSDITDAFDLVNYHIELGEFGYQFPMICDFAGDVNGDGYEDIVMSDHSRYYIYYNPLGGIVYKDFIRGDTNLDGKIDIADAIAVLQHLYSINAPLNCFDAGDANDDEKLDLADPIYILTHLFADGLPPPPPNECGQDPFGTLLDCRKSRCP